MFLISNQVYFERPRKHPSYDYPQDKASLLNPSPWLCAQARRQTRGALSPSLGHLQSTLGAISLIQGVLIDENSQPLCVPSLQAHRPSLRKGGKGCSGIYLLYRLLLIYYIQCINYRYIGYDCYSLSGRAHGLGAMPSLPRDAGEVFIGFQGKVKFSYCPAQGVDLRLVPQDIARSCIGHSSW